MIETQRPPRRGQEGTTNRMISTNIGFVQ
jgi:hypothetical protein